MHAGIWALAVSLYSVSRTSFYLLWQILHKRKHSGTLFVHKTYRTNSLLNLYSTFCTRVNVCFFSSWSPIRLKGESQSRNTAWFLPFCSSWASGFASGSCVSFVSVSALAKVCKPEKWMGCQIQLVQQIIIKTGKKFSCLYTVSVTQTVMRKLSSLLSEQIELSEADADVTGCVWLTVLRCSVIGLHCAERDLGIIWSRIEVDRVPL